MPVKTKEPRHAGYVVPVLWIMAAAQVATLVLLAVVLWNSTIERRFEEYNFRIIVRAMGKYATDQELITYYDGVLADLTAAAQQHEWIKHSSKYAIQVGFVKNEIAKLEKKLGLKPGECRYCTKGKLNPAAVLPAPR